MAYALLIFGAAFAAFCVWLAVRILNRRERWAKWTAVGMLCMLLLYPFSYGPAYWLYLKMGAPEWAWSAIDSTFEPLRWVRANAPFRVRDAMYDYDAWWADLELRR